MRRRKFVLAFVPLLLVLAVVVSIPVFAIVPIDSYTYWEDTGDSRKAVYNKAMYGAAFIKSANDMSIAEFSELSDICTDSNDNIYILDKESRIVVLNSDYTVIREIGLIDGSESYDEAEGIYVHTDNTIYICDTLGKRIIHCTQTGNLIEIIGLPESSLIPDDFDFKPTALVLDQYNYMYVLSDGSYQGALLYSPEKEFLGFFGANDVKTSVSDVLSNIFNRIFPNNAKKANTSRTLPYCFVDLSIDQEGFIYTCNGFTETSDRSGQIRKLSRGMGSDILDSSSVNFVDTKMSSTKYRGFSEQNICSLDVDSDGFIYALESKYGKIFIYDESCRIISVFGGGMGEGTQKGTFQFSDSIALKNDAQEVLVIDNKTNLLTVFQITEYGKLVKELNALSSEGHYAEAKQGWEEVLKQDANFQPAYSGLANAYIGEKDYETAIEYAKMGYDREAFAVAFEHVRKDFINDNFILIFIVLFIVVAGTISLLFLTTKKQIIFIKNKELKLMLSTPLHPSDNFTNIKEKHLGSIPLCIVLVLLFYVVTVLQTLASGFMFSYYDPASFNSIWAFARTVGFVVLFVVANWMICSLLGGKGRFKEIIIVTCYSLLPIIVGKTLEIILTHVLLAEEASFLGILDVVIILYFIIMMIIGLTKIHDFSMSRLVGTTLLTLFSMLAVIFLIVLVFILAQQFCGFIITVVSELFMI